MHFVYNSRVKYAELDILEVAYTADGSQLADRFADLPGMAFLDSRGATSSGPGRWDLVTALPVEIVEIATFDHRVMDWLAALETRISREGYHPPPMDAPFGTGVVGFLDYDSSAQLHGISRIAEVPARAGLYPACVLQDHQRQRAWFVAEPGCPADIRSTLLARAQAVTHDGSAASSVALDAPFSADISAVEYRTAIARIQDYLRSGDCYQVNYAHRFSARFSGSAWALYRQLCEVLRGSFSAYLQLADHHAVLSFSPERFLTVQASEVTTQPIKGTAPRHHDVHEDHAAAEALQHSSKDLAENVMITDLLRNDLGHHCEPGSVRTTELAVLHSYRNVHHLVSTVTGRLRADVSPAALLAGCAPGGSITGAPKRRAVEIIAELEPHPRGAYCGNVFTLGGGNTLQSSIAIRTIEAIDETLVCWGGGGITIGSNAEDEYQETLDKVGGLLGAIPVQ